MIRIKNIQNMNCLKRVLHYCECLDVPNAYFYTTTVPHAVSPACKEGKPRSLVAGLGKYSGEVGEYCGDVPLPGPLTSPPAPEYLAEPKRMEGGRTPPKECLRSGFTPLQGVHTLACCSSVLLDSRETYSTNILPARVLGNV